MRIITCVDCDKLVICVTRIANRCPACAKVHNAVKNKLIQGRYHTSTRMQYAFDTMNTCNQCGTRFGAFSRHEKYCLDCKNIRRVECKHRHNLGLTFHEFAEIPEYHAYNEISKDANYRIDNDPNNIFNGSHFRKIDILGGVKDGWLIGATVTNIKTGVTKLAEELK